MSDKPSVSLIWPSLMAAVLGVYSYVTYQSPLDTQRPGQTNGVGFPEPPSPPWLNPHHARLWQDPLAVVYEEGPESRKSNLPMVRNYFRKAVDAAWASHIRPSLRKNKKTAEAGTGTKPRPDVVILPVFVPGGKYGEDRERRMRMRYALVSALSVCHYRAKFAERLNSISVPVYVDGAEVGLTPPKSICLDIPIELYVGDLTEGLFEDNKALTPESKSKASGKSKDAKPPKKDGPRKTPIMICWIDENLLGRRPLGVMAQVLEHLLKHEPSESPLKSAVRILGPADSDMLLTMAYENNDPQCFAAKNGSTDPCTAGRDNTPLTASYFGDKECSYFHDHVRIYSSRATLTPSLLRTEAADILQEFMNGKPSASGIIVSRIVGTDWQLAKEIRKELILRDAWEEESDEHHVVLITERDTLYGRAIVDSFKNSFGAENLTALSYLRGIDGQIPHSKNDSSKNSAEKSKHEHNKTGSVLRDHVEPEGPDQFDYLHRLEHRLLDLKDHLRQSGKGPVTAIGVVGIDVFDKLLVLREVRGRFPRAIFFTTDLDANFWRETEYPTTRNVIVASHFGLQLHPDLQRDVPAFRDSYQTSLFLATLLAADDQRTAKIMEHAAGRDSQTLWGPETLKLNASNPLQPLVFEIGRHGPYQLTITGGRGGLTPLLKDGEDEWEEQAKGWKKKNGKTKSLSALIHPTSERERTVGVWVWKQFGLGVVIILFLLASLSFHVKPLAGICQFILRVLKSTGLSVEQSGHAPPSEQKPSQFARRTFVLSRAECEERSTDGTAEVAKPFRHGRLILGIAFVALLLMYAISKDHANPQGEPFAWREGISIWPSTILHFVAMFISLWLFLKSKSQLKDNSERLRKSLKFRLPETGAFFPTETFYLWKFEKHVIATIFFVLLSLLLLSLSEMPHVPYRGDMAWWVSYISLLGAYSTVILLTQFVLIQVRYCRDQIKDFSDNDVNRKDPSKMHATVELIARRTNEVGKCLQYPFAILLLMYLAQANLFDYWRPSIPLAAIWAVLIVSLFYSAFMMRRDAYNARQKMIRILLTNNASKRTAPKRVNETITVLKNEDRGAYCPWSDDYLLKALAIPLGGGSGLILFQQWLW